MSDTPITATGTASRDEQIAELAHLRGTTLVTLVSTVEVLASTVSEVASAAREQNESIKELAADVHSKRNWRMVMGVGATAAAVALIVIGVLSLIQSHQNGVRAKTSQHTLDLVESATNPSGEISQRNAAGQAVTIQAMLDEMDRRTCLRLEAALHQPQGCPSPPTTVVPSGGSLSGIPG